MMGVKNPCISGKLARRSRMHWNGKRRPPGAGGRLSVCEATPDRRSKGIGAGTKEMKAVLTIPLREAVAYQSRDGLAHRTSK